MASVASSTLIGPPPDWPELLSKAPQPYPTMYEDNMESESVRYSVHRDLASQLEDLSDDEDELHSLLHALASTGFSYMIPLGRTLTAQEEKNEASSESGGESQGVGTDDEDAGGSENEGDLDAEMADEDDDGDDGENEGDGETVEDDEDEGSEEAY